MTKQKNHLNHKSKAWVILLLIAHIPVYHVLPQNSKLPMVSKYLEFRYALCIFHDVTPHQ